MAKPVKKAYFIGFRADRKTGMPHSANLISLDEGKHLLTSRIVTITTNPYRIETLNTIYEIVEPNPNQGEDHVS